MNRELVLRYLIDLIDLALAAGGDGRCRYLSERAQEDSNPHSRFRKPGPCPLDDRRLVLRGQHRVRTSALLRVRKMLSR
jgi:hypothetical protein